MKNLIRKVCFIVTVALLVMPVTSYALLKMELTQGVSGAIPIAVVPFAPKSAHASQQLSDIIATDLRNSGQFKVYGRPALSVFPSRVDAVSVPYFRKLGTDNVVIGQVDAQPSGSYKISFSLLNIYEKNKVMLTDHFEVDPAQLRAVAHHISDLIYEKITGVRGIFSTRLAYIVVQKQADGRKRYTLEVADQDGENPRPLLNSPQPIMSPSWSPDGKQLAYVSFEKRHAGIYIQNVSSGQRELLSDFKGINGAPAWSPDGKQLALVLSKSGSPNIYIMDLSHRKLRQVTNDFYINTEPAWSPDGRSLIYTSNRSGGPQIYQIKVSGGHPSRLTYDGHYNARGAFTPDGKFISMIHRVGGKFKIALVNLDRGTVKVLNKSAGDSASPSMAPNGRMILYDTLTNGRNVLGMVSSDGRIMLELPARNGGAQDPAWSPFL